MSSMQLTVEKTKQLIARLFAKHQINAGLGAAAMAELLVRMAIYEQVPKSEFLNTLSELYDRMSGKEEQEDEAPN